MNIKEMLNVLVSDDTVSKYDFKEILEMAVEIDTKTAIQDYYFGYYENDTCNDYADEKYEEYKEEKRGL